MNVYLLFFYFRFKSFWILINIHSKLRFNTFFIHFNFISEFQNALLELGAELHSTIKTGYTDFFYIPCTYTVHCTLYIDWTVGILNHRQRQCSVHTAQRLYYCIGHRRSYCIGHRLSYCIGHQLYSVHRIVWAVLYNIWTLNKDCP